MLPGTTSGDESSPPLRAVFYRFTSGDDIGQQKERGRLAAAPPCPRVLFVQTTTCAFRFLRQPNRPIAPRPEANSGRAAGSGVADKGELPMPWLMSSVYPAGVMKNGSMNALPVNASEPIFPMLAIISTLYSSPTIKGRILFKEREAFPEGQDVKSQKAATAGRGTSAPSRLEMESWAFAKERRSIVDANESDAEPAPCTGTSTVPALPLKRMKYVKFDCTSPPSPTMLGTDAYADNDGAA